MDINRENYMIWITDFYDGTLSDIQKEALYSFLELNKDLKEEFDSFKDIKLHPDISSRMVSKEALRKSIFDIDPELNEDEIALLTSEYGNTGLFIESAGLKLSPEEIDFPDKNKLRRIPRRSAIIKLGTRALAIAAGLAILISLFLFLPENNKPAQVYMAARMIPFNNSSIQGSDRLAPVLSDQRISPRAIRIMPREAVATLTEPADIVTPELIREEIFIKTVSFPDRVVLASAEEIQMPSLIEIEKQEVPLDYPDLSPRQFLALNFRKHILNEEDADAEKLKAYEVADAGISGLNKLLGWEMQFEKVTDEEGRLKAYKFTSQLINLDRKTKIADD